VTTKFYGSALLCLFACFTSWNVPLAAQVRNFSFCSAGVYGDGFVDWSQLPPPPTPLRNGPNGPVDVTLPVTGIPGLTVAIHIPVANMTPGEPPYQVSNSTDLTLNLQDGASPITLTFNQPVRGVRANLRVHGRFEYKLTVIANENPPGGPPPAEIDVSGFDFPGFQTKVAPLNVLSRQNDLTKLSFAGQGGEDIYFELINVRVQSAGLDLSKNVPVNGLRQWLRADQGTYVVPPPGLPPKISSLTDQSGNGIDATSPDPGNAPVLDYDGGHCTPVAEFNGQVLNANLPIAGWTDMTIFVAAESSIDDSQYPQFGENAALSWQENAPWGETFFTPLQSKVYFRFGTGQTNNLPRYLRPLDIGGDFSITTAMHDEREDLLFVNGKVVLRQRGRYSALSGVGAVETIGGGYNGTFFKGKIGEILVYDRALSDKEREAVEYYLKVKYGVL
jgi:hypothetical protein